MHYSSVEGEGLVVTRWSPLITEFKDVPHFTGAIAFKFKPAEDPPWTMMEALMIKMALKGN